MIRPCRLPPPACMFNEMLLLIPCHFLFVLLVTRLSHNQSWHWLTGGQSGRLWLWRMTFPNGRTCWDCLRVDVSWLVKMRGSTFLYMSLSSPSWSPECISPLVTTFSFSLFSLHDTPLPFHLLCCRFQAWSAGCVSRTEHVL